MAPVSHINLGVRNPAERTESLQAKSQQASLQAKSQQGGIARGNCSRSACPTTNRLHGLVPCRPAVHRGRASSQRSAACRKIRLAVDERSACRPLGVSTKQTCSLEQCQAPSGDGDSPGKAELHNLGETACELPLLEGNAEKSFEAEDQGVVQCDAPAQMTGRSDQCETDRSIVMLTEEALKVIERDTSLASTKIVGNLFAGVPSVCRNNDNDGSISEDGFSVESLHLERTAHDAIDEMLFNEIGLMSSIWVPAEESFSVSSLFQEPGSHLETCNVTWPANESCSASQSVLMAAADLIPDQTNESDTCATVFSQPSSKDREFSRTNSSNPELVVNSTQQLSLPVDSKSEDNSSSESGLANCMHRATELASSSRPPLPRHGTAEAVMHLPVPPGRESLRASARPSRLSSKARPSPLHSQHVAQVSQLTSPRHRSASGTPLNACRARRKADQCCDATTTYWLDSEDQGDWSTPELAALSRPSSLARSYVAPGAEIHNMDTSKTSIPFQVIE